MTVIQGRVDERRHPTALDQDIAAPAITVNQGRALRFHDPIAQTRGQTLDAIHHHHGQVPAIQGFPGHGQQPLIAEELQPANGGNIALRQTADHRIAVEAEGMPGVTVQIGQNLGGMALGRIIQGIAGGDIIHQQQIIAIMDHMGNRHAGLGGQQAQHPALHRDGGAGLGHHLAAIGQIHLPDRCARAAGHGPRPGHLASGITLDLPHQFRRHASRVLTWSSRPRDPASIMSSTRSKPSPAP